MYFCNLLLLFLQVKKYVERLAHSLLRPPLHLFYHYSVRLFQLLNQQTMFFKYLFLIIFTFLRDFVAQISTRTIVKVMQMQIETRADVKPFVEPKQFTLCKTNSPTAGIVS